MTASLISNNLLSDIALTLIHFLWQGLLVAAVLKLILVTISERKPHIKYLFATLAMVANVILPLITYYLISQPDNSQALAVKSINNTQGLSLSLFSEQPDYLSTLQTYLPYLTIIWVISIAFLSTRLLVQMFQVHRLPKTKVEYQFTELNEHFLSLVNKLQLKRIPKLVVSVSVHVPMAIGWLKPVVMLPASMVSGLTSEQLEMLFLHELAHIKRHDYLVNLIQSIVEILLFFHPAVHWISKQMRIEREYCSDDIAVQHCGDAFAYAHTLADTASICRKHHHQAIPEMAMAATGGELKNRIVRLVNKHHCTSTLNKSKWLAAIMISCTLIILSTQYLSQAFYLIEDQEFNKRPTTSLLNKTEALPTLLPSLQPIKSPVQNIAFIEASKNNSAFINNAPNDNAGFNLNANEITLSDNEELESAALSLNMNTAYKARNTSKNNLSVKATFSTNTAPAINITDTSTTTTTTKPAIENNENVIHKASDKLAINTPNNKILKKNKATPIKNAKQNNTQALVKTTELTQKQQPELSSFQPVVNFAVDENIKLSFVKNKALSSEVAIKNKEKEVFRNAQAISIIDPKYPSRAEFKGLELDLLVNFSINENGEVTNIEIEKKHKSRYFRSEIIKALAQWKFLPAQENGQPVASNMSKIFSFNLESTS